MPDDSISPADWAQKVTLVITHDPATGHTVVDRGALPHLFALAIISTLEEDFCWSDETYVDATAYGDDDE